MPRTKRSRMAMSPVHTNAAAIDIGATLHIAAVGPDRDPEPVRSSINKLLLMNGAGFRIVRTFLTQNYTYGHVTSIN